MHAMHALDEVAPAEPDAVPAGQFTHAELPAAVEYWPARQLEQAKPPRENWPAAQVAQEDDEVPPADSEAVPEGQLAHDELPAEVEYLPRGQFVHTDPAIVEYWPAAHEAHEVEEVAAVVS